MATRKYTPEKRALWNARRKERRALSQAAAAVVREAKRKAKADAETARCARCGETKAASCFGPDKRRPSGRRPYCKPCHNAGNENWRVRNPDRCKAASLAWDARNPERRKEIVRRSLRKRRSTAMGRLDIRVRNGVRWSVKHGKEGKKTFELLDFTLEELKRHIERQFHDGMTWGILMTGEIHIDHIRPLSSFNITSATCSEFKQAWALSNLRPLWAHDNLKKSGKRLFLI